MVNELIKLSLTGWNLFLGGTHKQRFLAYVAIGAIEGGTRAFIESATGICKKRREELFRREKELDSKLEKLKLDVTADLEKQAKEAFEETAHNIEQAKDTQSEIEELLRELDK